MVKNFLKTIKKQYVIAIILFAAVLVIAFVSFGTNKTSEAPQTDTEKYVSATEKRLEDALIKIDGVKRVKVVISVNGAIEQVYQTDEKSVTENGKTTVTTSTVFSGGKPILIGVKYPEITGVLVVCKGADDIGVSMDVLNAVRTILNVSCDKVRIISQ